MTYTDTEFALQIFSITVYIKLQKQQCDNERLLANDHTQPI